MSTLKVDVTVNNSHLTQGLNSAGAHVKKFAGEIKSTIAGAFGGAALVAAVKRTIDEIDQIQDASEELNLPVEQTQALDQAARKSSDSFEKLQSILLKIQDIQLDIFNGDTTTGAKGRSILSKMGISVEDFKKMSQEQIYQTFAKMQPSDLNTLLGGKMSRKFLKYRTSILEMDENTKTGLGNGTIKSSTYIAANDRQYAQMRKEWDEAWKPAIAAVTTRLLFLGNIIAKVIGWIADKLNMTESESQFNNDVDALGYSNWAKSRGVSLEPGKPGYVAQHMIENYGDVYDPRISPENILRMGEEQYIAGQWLAMRRKTRENDKSPMPSAFDGVTANGAKTYTDSLLSVGNFLGQSSDSMNVAASIAANTKRSADSLDRIIELLEDQGVLPDQQVWIGPMFQL